VRARSNKASYSVPQGARKQHMEQEHPMQQRCVWGLAEPQDGLHAREEVRVGEGAHAGEEVRAGEEGHAFAN